MKQKYDIRPVLEDSGEAYFSQADVASNIGVSSRTVARWDADNSLVATGYERADRDGKRVQYRWSGGSGYTSPLLGSDYVRESANDSTAPTQRYAAVSPHPFIHCKVNDDGRVSGGPLDKLHVRDVAGMGANVVLHHNKVEPTKEPKTSDMFGLDRTAPKRDKTPEQALGHGFQLAQARQNGRESHTGEIVGLGDSDDDTAFPQWSGD